MAYLSFVTFQGIFMTVAVHLQGSLTKRIWRYVWILVLFGTIIPTMILTWSYYFLVMNLYGASTQCALDKMSEGWSLKSAIYVSMDCLLLFLSLCIITTSLFPDMGNFPPWVWIQDLIHWVLSSPSRHLLRAQSPGISPRKKLFWQILFVMIIPIREFVFSVAFDLLRMYVMLIYAGNGVLYERTQAAYEGRQGDESEWGFGQILPVLLLAIPFFQLMEEITSRTYCSVSKSYISINFQINLS
jgi:hypothetical protein